MVEIEERIKDLEERVRCLENSTNSRSVENVSVDQRRLSVVEFAQGNFDNKTNLIVLFAYYLETYRDTKSFDTAMIDSLFMESRVVKPKNIKDLINKNLKKGLLMDADNNKGVKAWTLTRSGVNKAKELLQEND